MPLIVLTPDSFESYLTRCFGCFQELEEKRKQRAQVTYERKKQLIKLRKKAEKTAEEQLGTQINILDPIKY